MAAGLKRCAAETKQRHVFVFCFFSLVLLLLCCWHRDVIQPVMQGSEALKIALGGFRLRPIAYLPLLGDVIRLQAGPVFLPAAVRHLRFSCNTSHKKWSGAIIPPLPEDPLRRTQTCTLTNTCTSRHVRTLPSCMPSPRPGQRTSSIAQKEHHSLSHTRTYDHTHIKPDCAVTTKGFSSSADRPTFSQEGQS